MSPERERPLSNGAKVLIRMAQSVGVDPNPYVGEAKRLCQQAGRNKVGPFGSGREVFNTLRMRINAITHPVFGRRRP